MRNDIARQVFVGRTIDPNEFAFLSRVIKPGMVVADIGANEGLYTVFCASLVQPEGAVLAFEPSPRERARLKENVHLNSLSNIEVLPLALADFCGEVCLHIADDLHAGHNTLGRFIYDVPLASVETVEAVTLDSLFETRGWTRLDIVKADIEGAELRFLRGAERTLRRCCPLILMEASAQALEAQDCTVEQLFGFLHRLSYEIYSFSADTGLPVPAARPPSRENHNFVAIPDSAARNARTLLYNLDWAQ
jgi:FkbM family methyltransferase